MKLTCNAAVRLFSALRSLDSADNVRLSGQIRLDIARNINRLFPEVEAFERAVGRKRREIVPGEANIAANNAIVAEMEAMGADTIELKLYKLDHTKLNLDDNPRITGDMIAALAPILKDFDTMEDGAE